MNLQIVRSIRKTWQCVTASLRTTSLDLKIQQAGSHVNVKKNTPGTLEIRWNSTAAYVHMPPEVAVLLAIDISDLKQLKSADYAQFKITLTFCACVNVAID